MIGARTRCPWGENLCATSSTFAGRRHMIGKVVTGCVAILPYHTATQDRGSECRDFGFISRIVTALLFSLLHRIVRSTWRMPSLRKHSESGTRFETATLIGLIADEWQFNYIQWTMIGVDRLSAPILSIFTIIDNGHFQNRFADNVFFFFLDYANKHTIYRWHYLLVNY